jgi:hypothetical protein
MMDHLSSLELPDVMRSSTRFIKSSESHPHTVEPELRSSPRESVGATVGALEVAPAVGSGALRHSETKVITTLGDKPVLEPGFSPRVAAEHIRWSATCPQKQFQQRDRFASGMGQQHHSRAPGLAFCGPHAKHLAGREPASPQSPRPLVSPGERAPVGTGGGPIRSTHQTGGPRAWKGGSAVRRSRIPRL